MRVLDWSKAGETRVHPGPGPGIYTGIPCPASGAMFDRRTTTTGLAMLLVVSAAVPAATVHSPVSDHPLTIRRRSSYSIFAFVVLTG